MKKEKELFRQLVNFGMADLFNDDTHTNAPDNVVAAGDPVHRVDPECELLNVKNPLGDDGVQFLVCGNSMSPLGIDDGDNLFVRKYDAVTNGVKEGDFLIVKVDPTYYENEKPNYKYKLRSAIMVVEASWSVDEIIEKLKRMDSQTDIWLGMNRKCLRTKWTKARRHYPEGMLVLSTTYRNGILQYSFHRPEFVEYKVACLVRPEAANTVIPIEEVA